MYYLLTRENGEKYVKGLEERKKHLPLFNHEASKSLSKTELNNNMKERALDIYKDTINNLTKSEQIDNYNSLQAIKTVDPTIEFIVVSFEYQKKLYLCKVNEDKKLEYLYEVESPVISQKNNPNQNKEHVTSSLTPSNIPNSSASSSYQQKSTSTQKQNKGKEPAKPAKQAFVALSEEAINKMFNWLNQPLNPVESINSRTVFLHNHIINDTVLQYLVRL